MRAGSRLELARRTQTSRVMDVGAWNDAGVSMERDRDRLEGLRNIHRQRLIDRYLDTGEGGKAGGRKVPPSVDNRRRA